jgi:hypothetical protein
MRGVNPAPGALSSGAFFQSGQARQPLASSRRILRLLPEGRDVVVMDVFRVAMEQIVAATKLNAGQLVLASFDPIGIVHENHGPQS